MAAPTVIATQKKNNMRKILFLLVLLVGALVPAVAQTATPDSVFVVRNGRIFSAYEVEIGRAHV